MNRFWQILAAAAFFCVLALPAAAQEDPAKMDPPVISEEMLPPGAEPADVEIMFGEEDWAQAEMGECIRMLAEEGLTEDEAQTECDAILNEDYWKAELDEPGMDPEAEVGLMPGEADAQAMDEQGSMEY